MLCRHVRRKGFTLVEILIVVIILGILAAMVIPQFTNASSDARSNALKDQLRSIRNQIELYQAQHGVLPDLITDWTPLTTATTGPDGKTYGPYLMDVPTNPLNHSSFVVDGADTGNPSGGGGFFYDYSGGSGKIYGFDADQATVIVDP